MILCHEHLTELKTAVSERGLGRFVSSNPGEAAACLKGGRYDSMLSAQVAIFRYAVQQFRREIISAETLCPVCYVANTCGCGVAGCGSRVIANAADVALEDAIELKLVELV